MALFAATTTVGEPMDHDAGEPRDLSPFCGNCGTAFGESQAPFCGNCGARRGAAPPARAAQPVQPVQPVQPAPPTVPVAVPADAPATAPAPVIDVAAFGAPKASTGRGRRGPAVAIGAGALALALGGAGLIGWNLLSGGGASSPEAAGEEFVTALVSQDVVAVLDTVLPGEVEGVADVVESQLERRRDSGDLAERGLTEAVTITVDDTVWEVEEHGDDVALVELTDMELTVEWDLDKIEDAQLAALVDLVDREERRGSRTFTADDLDALRDDEGVDPTFVTVREGGDWYVSMVGTVERLYFQAEFHDTDDDVFDPDGLDWRRVGEPDAPIVGATPEEVVENALSAVNDTDVASGLAQLPAGQVAALWAAVDPLQELLEAALGDERGALTLDLRSFDAEESAADGDLVEVRVTGFRAGVEYVDPDGADDCYDDDYYCEEFDDSFAIEVVFEDGCFLAEGETACLSDAGVGRNVFPDDTIVLMMRKVDGGYQWDAVATALRYFEVLEESGDLFDEDVWEL